MASAELAACATRPILVQNFIEELNRLVPKLTRQIPWLRVFVEGVVIGAHAVRGESRLSRGRVIVSVDAPGHSHGSSFRWDGRPKAYPP